MIFELFFSLLLSSHFQLGTALIFRGYFLVIVLILFGWRWYGRLGDLLHE